MKMITTTSDYGIAAFEYAGMLSFSYMKRSGLALKFGIIKIGQPVKRVASVPFDYCTQQMDKLGKVFKRKNEIEERLIAIDDRLERIIGRSADIEKSGFVVAEKQKPDKEIEERLVAIDDKLERIIRRLADIEKSGVVVAEKQKPAKEKKQINEGNKMFFKAIADDNIQLMHQQEGNQ